ncbi:Dabb family protein [Thermophagus sp. OGC60D27]|uniref:Dabb family protein n=1 Tax=Thermophagus sp. OGC60D27 TaxID=3458415 RepID=UPI00403798BA
MIKHIVLFKFKSSTNEANKKSQILSIKTNLEALIDKTESLKKIEVGINCNDNEKYDMALTTEFEDMEGLKAYATHPEHLKVLAMIKEILVERACVDYEV